MHAAPLPLRHLDRRGETLDSLPRALRQGTAAIGAAREWTTRAVSGEGGGVTKEQLLAKLIELKADPPGDAEAIHWEADRALLDFIDDKEIEKAFDALEKWYA
jgi:hypothetical protein